MEDFKITKKEFDEFIEHREELIQSVKKLISFQGTNEEFYSDEDSIQQFLDIYFNAYKNGNHEIADEISPKVWEIVMFEDDDRKMFVNLLESLKEDYPK